MAQSQVISQEDVHPDDAAIYDQLARLQGMYNQVGQMRTLLPDKLIEPTRFARQAPPEKVALQLRDAAIAGSNQIRDFKKAYHSEDMRALFQTVSTADFPQGYDVWTIDYTKSLPATKSAPTGSNPAAAQAQDISSVVDKFREAHPDVKVESSQLPIDLKVGSMAFQVQSAEADGQFEVASTEGSATDVIQGAVLKYIKKAHARLGLHTLLSLLASYKNIKSTPCQKCHKLIDSDFQLPLARQQLEQKDGDEMDWKIVHQSCV